ncbi:murein tripeptide amidase MpaA [Vibrio ishigakensis]|uniref:murein tripeptide amidase MpaA n=1 Tax=Vibrio ishigakensis TaxID=1481914 RepID=UPI0036F23DBB
MQKLRQRSERASFMIKSVKYGQSVLGAPLLYFPSQSGEESRGLIIAGTHGDENASMVALSCALRSIHAQDLNHDVVISVNPDGNQLGTRANANQVDLNRAFPTQSWRAGGDVYRWSTNCDVRDVKVSTGSSESREPEITHLIKLIEERAPKFIVSFHEPLACIDDPDTSELGHWLAEKFELPMVKDVGYVTQGSFGTWCKEKNIPCVTVELPPISNDAAIEAYLTPMIELLQK